MSIQKFRSLFYLLFFCIGLYCNASAQTGTKDSAAKKTLISLPDFENFNEAQKNAGIMMKKFDSLRMASSDPDTDSLSFVFLTTEVNYEIQSLDHRHRVFEWQLASSKYIFIVVNVIVSVGLLLSVWQFYLPIYKMNKMMKRNEVTKAESQTIIEDEEKKETHVSTIKLGKDGVEITSPVIGLLILVISIAFYFLYINFVYPVSEIAHP